MPGKIKRARGLRCTFGRGDNGAAQGGSSSTQKICSQHFQTWILGITLSSYIKGGSSLGFWARFWKKGALFEGGETPHTGSAQELLAAFESVPVVQQRDTDPWVFSRLLETSEVWRKPPQTPPVPAQSCVDATGWLAGSVYFLRRCGNLGKCKFMW